MKPLLSVVLLLIADWATSATVAVGNEAAAEPVNGTAGNRVDRFGDELPTGALLRLGTTRLRNAQGVEGVAFSPDGKLLASCGWDDSIRLWDTATSQPAGRLITDEDDGTFAVAFLLCVEGCKNRSVNSILESIERINSRPLSAYQTAFMNSPCNPYWAIAMSRSSASTSPSKLKSPS